MSLQRFLSVPVGVHGSGKNPGRRCIYPLVRVAAVLCVAAWVAPFLAASAQETRCVVLEIYFDGSSQDSLAMDAVSRFAAGRAGLLLVRRDVSVDRNAERLKTITEHFQVHSQQLPVAYACNRVVVWDGRQRAFLDGLRGMMQMEVFVRTGCARCAKAKVYLAAFSRRYPGLPVVYRDLVTESSAVYDLNLLVQRHHQAAASVPVFHFCHQLIVGFDQPESTGARLERALARWTTPCSPSTDPRSHASWLRRDPGAPGLPLAHLAALGLLNVQPPPENPAPELPLPGAPAIDLPLPAEDEGPPEPGDAADAGRIPDTPLPAAGNEADVIELPWWGSMDVRKLGMPLFTVAIGLVDGFNPCAMWVLLFLLSLLVNLHSRSRILAVAGSFVVVSGLAYFAFMAAWLNVFLFVGYVRIVQVILGLLGITVGLIHVKDFFAFKQGVTLSIPESAKPGIYSRTRAILNAENLLGAIIGATILAVLVNIIELLCTAGLPALYTQVLANQNLQAWQHYAYLSLYIAAYMFDDSLMVAAVVVTLSKRKMQETQGRWLKLVSGAVILALGLVMVVYPEALM